MKSVLANNPDYLQNVVAGHGVRVAAFNIPGLALVTSAGEIAATETYQQAAEIGGAALLAAGVISGAFAVMRQRQLNSLNSRLYPE